LHKGDVLRRYVGIDLAHLFEISAGRDDAVARAQCGLGSSCSDAATGSCNKSNFAHILAL
jgi:hypothetical protein